MEPRKPTVYLLQAQNLAQGLWAWAHVNAAQECSTAKHPALLTFWSSHLHFCKEPIFFVILPDPEKSGSQHRPWVYFWVNASWDLAGKTIWDEIFRLFGKIFRLFGKTEYRPR